MDPITVYHFGKIRQQEILESCQRNRWKSEEPGLIVTLWQRLLSAMRARNERQRAPQAVVCVEQRENFAPSR